MRELKELFDLYELEMQAKPPLQDDAPTNYEGPNKDDFQHPITKRTNEIDSLIAQGEDPIKAHHAVYGDTDTADVQSKAALASTLGRIQDDGVKRGVTISKNSESLLAKDAQIEKQQNQVTRDDLRTPMNQKVPDNEQTPQDQVAEQLDNQEEYDYNEDVAYLQKFGRA